MAVVTLASKSDIILGIDLEAGQLGVVQNTSYEGLVVMGLAKSKLDMSFVCLSTGHFWSKDADNITVRLLGENEIVSLKNS